jgi:hypothetical protein
MWRCKSLSDTQLLCIFIRRLSSSCFATMGETSNYPMLGFELNPGRSLPITKQETKRYCKPLSVSLIHQLSTLSCRLLWICFLEHSPREEERQEYVCSGMQKQSARGGKRGLEVLCIHIRIDSNRRRKSRMASS